MKATILDTHKVVDVICDKYLKKNVSGQFAKEVSSRKSPA